MFHVCSCHTGVQAALSTADAPRRSFLRDSGDRVPDPSDRVGCGDPAPAIRPPIA
jgi:hypothetical protein